jgi:hypothetical protein
MLNIAIFILKACFSIKNFILNFRLDFNRKTIFNINASTRILLLKEDFILIEDNLLCFLI